MADELEPTVTPETGVEEAPAAEGQETTPVVEPQAQQTDDLQPEAFAKRLSAAKDQWESKNKRYIDAAKALESAGYSLDSVLNDLTKRSVEQLVEQGMDETTAQELVNAKREAEQARREAAEARLGAEGTRLAGIYDGKNGEPAYDHDAVLAFAQQRANETGEELSLESAYLLWSRAESRKAGEQAALRALRAGQEKKVDAGAKGAGKKSIEDMDPLSDEFQRMMDDVLSGKKVDL